MRPPERSNPTDQYRTRGLKLLQRSEFAEAAEQFRRVVRDVPNSANDRALWANALARSGRVAEAIAEMHVALPLQPANPKLPEDWTALSDPFDVISFDFSKKIAAEQRWSLPVAATGSGIVQGIVLWFDLLLDQTRRFLSGPGGQARHWQKMLFVFKRERPVTPGGMVAISAEMGGNVFHFEI